MAHYAFSDLHGNLRAWRAIQQRVSSDDSLFCLGDVADRGPDGFQMLKEILADPRVTYIKGNHDDMFAESVISGSGIFDHWILKCGGKSTYEGWLKDGRPSDIVLKLMDAPLYKAIVTKQGLILLSHAGYTPRKTKTELPSKTDFLWDRSHFGDPWELGDAKVFVVHGHTPVKYLDGSRCCRPVFYAGGHKICIDLGTHSTNCCTLLNLDDFSYEVIEA